MSAKLIRRLHFGLLATLIAEAIFVFFLTFVRPRNSIADSWVYSEPILLFIFPLLLICILVFEFHKATFPNREYENDSEPKSVARKVLRTCSVLSIIPFLQAHVKQYKSIEALVTGNTERAETLIFLSRFYFTLGLVLVAITAFNVFKLHYIISNINQSEGTSEPEDKIAI